VGVTITGEALIDSTGKVLIDMTKVAIGEDTRRREEKTTVITDRLFAKGHRK
jgi:hypothetical protein